MTIFFWRVFLSSRFLDLETILSILSNKIIRLALWGATNSYPQLTVVQSQLGLGDIKRR